MSTDTIDSNAARVAELDTLIQALEQDAAGLKARMATLRAQMAPSDEALRNGTIRESQRRERARIAEEIGKASRALADIEERMRPRVDERAGLQAEIAESRKQAITVETLQDGVEEAQAILADLESKRPATVSALAKASERRAEVEEIERAERIASEALDTARADAFLSAAGTKKRETADEAVNTADMALSLAKEKAAMARAALPRIDSTISQRQADLSALDARIEAARQVVRDRAKALDMKKARDAYEAAVAALGEAVTSIHAIDREKGGTIFEVLRNVGLRTFGQHDRPEALPQWLRRGVVAP